MREGALVMKTLDLHPNSLPFYEEGITVCIGFFDGFHRGHLELLKCAKRLPYRVAMMTFEVGNGNIKRQKAYLTSREDKSAWFSHFGADEEWIFQLDEIKDQSPLAFVEMLKKINVKEVVVGRDFTFGKKALGKAEDLMHLAGNHFHTHIVDLLEENGKISSSRIRSEILSGQLIEATTHLGHPYFIKGKVTRGLQNGRKMGFPTANISLQFPYLLPPVGVYGVWVYYQGKKYPAMANIGTHPTIDPLKKAILEIHLFDFHQEIYDEPLVIAFVFFLRPEKKFASLEDLEEELSRNREEIYSRLENLESNRIHTSDENWKMVDAIFKKK